MPYVSLNVVLLRAEGLHAVRGVPLLPMQHAVAEKHRAVRAWRADRTAPPRTRERLVFRVRFVFQKKQSSAWGIWCRLRLAQPQADGI